MSQELLISDALDIFVMVEMTATELNKHSFWVYTTPADFALPRLGGSTGRVWCSVLVSVISEYGAVCWYL